MRVDYNSPLNKRFVNLSGMLLGYLVQVWEVFVEDVLGCLGVMCGMCLKGF